jgi:hypothetical protein
MVFQGCSLVLRRISHHVPTATAVLRGGSATMWRAQASSSSSSSRWMSSDISGMSLPHHPPPAFLDEEMAVGVQNATQLFLNHGLGKRKLELIAKEKERSLVDRWQEMMGAFLGSQAHVLAGLGYEASEQGIGMYNQHLSLLMQSADPDTQEKLRIKGRDTWRQVLLASFDVPQAHVPTEELSIVDARNITHKVSQKMQDPEILDIIAKRCQEAKPGTSRKLICVSISIFYNFFNYRLFICIFHVSDVS